MKISHIINTIEITERSKKAYLHVAQPTTIESMRRARNSGGSLAEIQLMSIRHCKENVELPQGFEAAKELFRYAYEVIPELEEPPYRPLPLLGDIVSSHFESTDAEFLIYTNLDIGVFPTFYHRIVELIEEGYDAVCINRITLPKFYCGIALDNLSIDLVGGIPGRRHPGLDCFVFRREIVPQLDFGNVFIGSPPVGLVFKTQIEKNSKRFKWIKNERLTFHLGDDQAWSGKACKYRAANRREAQDRFQDCLNLGYSKRILNGVRRRLDSDWDRA